LGNPTSGNRGGLGQTNASQMGGRGGLGQNPPSLLSLPQQPRAPPPPPTGNKED
jgi:hypothetical protein